MKVSVFGAGYVGLVTAACLAEMGNDVLCVDPDDTKICRLAHGTLPIQEPGLLEIVDRNLEANRLRFGTDLREGVKFGIIQFIAVGTPPIEGGAADISNVLAVARCVGLHMTEYKLVVDKSTVPVGSADDVSASIAISQSERGVSLPYSVVSNPEFLKEGSALEDFLHPDRIVVGVRRCDERARDLIQQLYAPLQLTGDKLLFMDVRSAELTKYAANAMLATRISFMNEIAMLAQKLGADIEQVRRGIGADTRIGREFLRAGCGYGGSCLPKDIQALLHSAAVVNQPLDLLTAVQRVNQRQMLVLIDFVVGRFGADLRGRRFALWGLSFKPDTDDMRQAPSRVVVAELVLRGAQVIAHDPVAMDEARRVFAGVEQVTFAATPIEALESADALIVVTEWNEYLAPDFDRIRAALRQPVLLDGRNIFDPIRMKNLGFEYFSIGRPAARSPEGEIASGKRLAALHTESKVENNA